MTAVEWLQEQIFNSDWKNMNGEDKLMLFEESKQMEKEQIINAYKNGQKIVEQYYNETYENKQKQ